MIHELRTKLMKNSDHMSVGRFSYGCPKVLRFPSAGHLRVGSFCSIADEVTILLGGEHVADRVSTYPFNALWEDDGLPQHEVSRGDVVLGNDVWVGYGAVILSGVSVGDGAIVGAGSVVASDIPPFSVAAGNPARVLRQRFTPEVESALREIHWWDWPEEEIRAIAPKLMSDPAAFCKEVLCPGAW